MSADVTRSCPWRRPVPTVSFFGDADPQFFWDDGLAAAVGMLGGASSADWLAEANGCDSEAELLDLPTVHEDGTAVTLWSFRNCSDGSDVDFYRIVGGGHTWPGSPLNLDPGFGRKTHNLDASATMVDFLLGHALPAAGGAP
jgi:polyhydroxybutyrate depolymerase